MIRPLLVALFASLILLALSVLYGRAMHDRWQEAKALVAARTAERDADRTQGKLWAAHAKRLEDELKKSAPLCAAELAAYAGRTTTRRRTANLRLVSDNANPIDPARSVALRRFVLDAGVQQQEPVASS